MLEIIKQRCGIASAIKVYDEDIKMYIEDCKEDLIASGVPKSLVERETPAIITAVTLYVKAYLGDDRTDTEKYLDLYRKKVFRLTLEEETEEVAPVQPEEVDNVE